MDEANEYDRRYLAGVVLFNRGDFFEAHEVWEDLWMNCAGQNGRELSIFQSLRQAKMRVIWRASSTFQMPSRCRRNVLSTTSYSTSCMRLIIR